MIQVQSPIPEDVVRLDVPDYITAIPLGELQSIYHNSLKDSCEADEHIRNAARPFLTPFEIDGDSWGVPSIEDIVDKLCAKLSEK